ALVADDGLLARLTTVLGGSNFLARLLIRRPEFVAEILAAPDLGGEKKYNRHVRELTDALAGDTSIEGLWRALRRHKQREIFRIGTRDLTGVGDLTSVVHDLSALAAGACEVATEATLRRMIALHGRPRQVDEDGSLRDAEFCVFGMGKLGSRELNFSSDVDLIYVHTTDAGRLVHEDGSVNERLSLREFFHRVARDVTAALHEPTEDGFVFRVDLRLRPEGTKGPISNSLRAMEMYYESFGQTWERGALLKARAIAGSRDLGREFLALVEPFVFRRFVDYAMVDEVKAMKEKIDRELHLRREAERNVKLGTGGIREIEFIIQAHQLLRAGKHRGLRIRDTERALRKLVQRSLLAESAAEELIEAYRFLRRLEHRIQIDEERQTHLMPTGVPQLAKVARLMGAQTYGVEAVEELDQQLRRVMMRVHRHFARLFHEPRKRLGQTRRPYVTALVAGELPKDEAIARLRELGFHEAERAQGMLERLREGPAHVHLSERALKELRVLGPKLLEEATQSSDPDRALLGVERFLNAVGARTSYYAMLAQNPGIITLLVRLFSGSEFLSNFLILHPWLLDTFIRSDSLAVRMTLDELRGELREYMRFAVDYEEQLNVLRRFKNEEVLRVAVQDITDVFDIDEVTEQLSAIAQVSVQAALQIAQHQLWQRYAPPFGDARRNAGFTVIGMGKVGSREINYHSDLDLIFLYAPPPPGDAPAAPVAGRKQLGPQEYFSRLAQRLVSVLTTVTTEGAVYEIDMRLRPSGNQGPLVTSCAGFLDYHRRSAQLWERQALLKARAVAGDLELGERTLAEVRAYMAGLPFTVDDLNQIRSMRARMGDELTVKGRETLHLKYGPGTLVDIEFLVQACHLYLGSAASRSGGKATVESLRQMAAEGLLEEGEAETLIDAYRFLRRVESGLRIIHDRSAAELPDDPALLGPLATRLGFAGPREETSQALLARYRAVTGAVAQLTREVLDRLQVRIERETPA
ncbi:MAG: bifunctional [glutamate--ammonia ligase]-adenylyl-L-tyrosine phosphorylase/[glutamate--ammonia-ligase] adenylyltransferase, partial [Myxococcales bacterium]|nr:bifunctional [glutamate--ammonia ligase]-adenylyl-L-tyrosine phosphorylase/[glutamate--ammonia-ligase] adenylyltransferase [Myxococcales bacterium]